MTVLSTDLAERFGVAAEEVNPAYTSQACSCCGYDAAHRLTHLF